MRRISALGLGAATALLPTLAHAQDGLQDAADSGDTAWLLISSVLVLLMALPGLALFYGGRVRAKNVLSIWVQVGAVVAAVSLLWIVCGYTLAFGHVTSGWLGAGNAWMLLDLGNVRENTLVPESGFALFQLAAAALAPALMVGGWAGRARLGWVAVFCAVWSLAVYAPVAHWVWGGGWLQATLGTLDFAGGIAIHTAAGVSALVAAALLGKRHGFAKAPLLPHSPALTMAGAALLWAGWFGLSGGAALAANDDAAVAIVNTHIAACMAALAWLGIERLTTGKPSGTGFATGALAGLVTVSPAAGFISPGAALVLGLVAAGLCHPALRLVRRRLEIDDSLGVFALHGVGGIAGSLLVALFVSPALGGTGYPEGATMLSQFAAQAVGVGVVAVWAAVATTVIAVAVSLAFPMRVGEDDERKGLDIASHGERAWDFDQAA